MKFLHLFDNEAHIHHIVLSLWKFVLRTEKNHKTMVTLGQIFRKSFVFLFINCHLTYCWTSFPMLCHTRGSFKLGKILPNTCCICHNNHPPKLPDKAKLLENFHLCDKGIVLGRKRQWRAHRIALTGWLTLVLNCVLPPLFEPSSGNGPHKWLFGNVVL